jgi:SOS-response transcriptional repressor LexA
MVDKNEFRAQFTARLHEALDDAGIRSRGRGVDIHRQLKILGVDKTTQAVSKWLNAEAIAEADSMAALCSWLKVRREWLEYGVLPKGQASEVNVNQLAVGEASNIAEIMQRFGKVPLISWVQAGAWCEAISNFEPYDADSWLSCPVPISEYGYALRVVGDSMTNPGPGRSYPAGCIIFVDPEIEAHPMKLHSKF